MFYDSLDTALVNLGSAVPAFIGLSYAICQLFLFEFNILKHKILIKPINLLLLLNFDRNFTDFNFFNYRYWIIFTTMIIF